MANEPERLLDDGSVVLHDLVQRSTLDALREQLGPYLRGEYPGRNEFEGLSSERVHGLARTHCRRRGTRST